MQFARKSAGFTLIELVVAMVIVAILAAIAIPAYSGYVRQARRTEAKSALLDLASLEERFFSVNNSYTSDQTQLGYGGTAGSSFSVGSGYYNVTITGVNPASSSITAGVTTTTPATYTLTATPTGDQLKDTSCPSFTLNQQGVQGPSATAATCWH
jgi:type IV pilus assembly protein PilE